MKEKIKETIKGNLLNLQGTRLKRRIVVIESDDWGAIRLPSIDSLNELERAGVNVDNDHYIRNDSLASESDLSNLFEILSSLKNSEGESPKLTANTILANPDFNKIKADDYRVYHYELFTKTLKRYPEHSHSFNLWKEGMAAELFHPQFHGREHLHVNRWLEGLAVRGSETAKAFNLNLYAICSDSSSEDRNSYMAAWEWENEKDKKFIFNAVEDGLRLFKKVFNYQSRSIISPNYTWNFDVESILKTGGVRYIQGSTVQRSPEINKKNNNLIRHYTGQQNKLGQHYLVRNCKFEPTSNPDKDWVKSCLSEIKNAFFWKKPAIIETHRVNYIGYINPENRDRNLKLLEELLTIIIKTWPDVEFMTSDQLGAFIESGK